MLTKISESTKQNEQKVFDVLFQSIDSNKSFVFSSGAGSGKTYALVKCLNYVISKKGSMLRSTGQTVVCITYTNVATNEIEKRLKNNDLVLVSTIHERIWSFIYKYQNELVTIHADKLNSEIKNENKKLQGNIPAALSSYDSSLVDKIHKIVMGEDFRKKFWEGYGLNATDFKSQISTFFPNDIADKILKNVAIFKTWIICLYRIEAYNNCLNHIQNRDYGFTEVIYDVMSNQDHLDRMRISHDTLLEYGQKMVSRYPLLAQVIVDQHPYFFIDEYQDTNQKVITIVNDLLKSARNNGHPFLAGLFGDPVQNIYDDGVGDVNGKILDDEINSIKKTYNRRSCKEIIDIGNHIRNDSIGQESVYDDCTGGSVKFFYLNSGCTEKEQMTKQFIEDMKKELKIGNNGRIDCFVLTNKFLAQAVEIGEFFDIFSSLPYYKRHYDQLNSETLSNDLTKLGGFQRQLYNFVHFFIGIQSFSTPISSLFSQVILKDLTIKQLQQLVRMNKDLCGNSLGDIFIKIENVVGQHKDEVSCGKLTNNLIELTSGNSLPQIELKKVFFEQFQRLSGSDIKTEESEETKLYSKLLNLDFHILEKWVQYIDRSKTSGVVYHTYHGTKGSEFQNVIIILDKDFGKIKGYFSSYLKDTTDSNESDSFVKAKNLLYVAVTRTIQNLRILYRDDISEIKKGVERIFNSCEEYNPEKKY